MTPLDSAHAAMQAAENTASGDAARLQFYEQLADTELFVLLTQEALGDSISPELFEVETGRFVLAFDQQEFYSNPFHHEQQNQTELHLKLKEFLHHSLLLVLL